MDPTQCDHIVGWLHCLYERRGIRPNGDGPESPRPVHQAETANIVETYRADLAKLGVSYRSCHRISDEAIITSKVERFRFCPRCGTDLFAEFVA